MTSFGVFEEFYATTWLTKQSASSISWIGSVQIFFEYFIAPFSGILYVSYPGAFLADPLTLPQA